MGAAVAYFVQRKCPSLFQNVIFISSMFQIKDELCNKLAKDLIVFIFGGQEGVHAIEILPVRPCRDLTRPKIQKRWKSYKTLRIGTKERGA